MKKGSRSLRAFISILGLLCFLGGTAGAAERVTVAFIIASNEGNDINLVNDAYRDEIIRLFSYRSYKQVDQVLLQLESGRTETVELPGNYRLSLDLEEKSGKHYNVRAAIRKEGIVYVDTTLSIDQSGVAFLGGPPAEDGDLILVLEMGF